MLEKKIEDLKIFQMLDVLFAEHKELFEFLSGDDDIGEYSISLGNKTYRVGMNYCMSTETFSYGFVKSK